MYKKMQCNSSIYFFKACIKSIDRGNILFGSKVELVSFLIQIKCIICSKHCKAAKMHVKKAECAAMHEKNTHISQFLIIYDDGGGM